MEVSVPQQTPKPEGNSQTGSRRTQKAVEAEMKSTMDKLRMTTGKAISKSDGFIWYKQDKFLIFSRKAHVKFRKDNPIFYEQIPVLLPRLEKIEKNVYEPCTYCKYDPKVTTTQSIMNAKLSHHRFWHFHENSLIKTIQMIPHHVLMQVSSQLPFTVDYGLSWFILILSKRKLT